MNSFFVVSCDILYFVRYKKHNDSASENYEGETLACTYVGR